MSHLRERRHHGSRCSSFGKLNMEGSSEPLLGGWTRGGMPKLGPGKGSQTMAYKERLVQGSESARPHRVRRRVDRITQGRPLILHSVRQQQHDHVPQILVMPIAGEAHRRDDPIHAMDAQAVRPAARQTRMLVGASTPGTRATVQRTHGASDIHRGKIEPAYIHFCAGT